MTKLISYFLPLGHSDLILQFARRDIEAKYRQSWLGMAWLLLAPLLMLTIYTLVFRHIFQVRWAPPEEGNLAFALRLYTGLLIFNFFAECINRAPSLMLEQPHLIKKVVFPLEILPWATVLSACVQLLIGGAILLVLHLIGLGNIPLSALALPLVWLPLLPLCLGLTWLLSAVGLFIRDIGQIVSLTMSALVFISPVFFPVEVLPAKVQEWMWLNPLAPIMTQTRTVLLQGQWPDWSQFLLSLATCTLIAVAGAVVFKRLREGFSDVI